MATYLDATDVVVVIEHKDDSGATVTPSAISYSLYDEIDTRLVGPLSPSVGSGNSTSVTISSLYNTLAAGQINGARQLKATITHSGGVIKKNIFYLLKSDIALVIPKTSFVTMAGAMAAAMSMPDLDTFTAATELDRTIALMESYLKISRLAFNVETSTGDTMSIITWPGESLTKTGLSAANFAIMTPAEFFLLPLRFREALARAQVAEANDVLVEDPISDRVRAGLLSETIGESSMMFKSVRPLERGVSRRAIQYLSEFMSTRVVIGRA
jgi:hypothetical protein